MGNRYLVFITFLGLELPNPLEFPKWWEWQKCLSIDQVTLGKPLRMGTGCLRRVGLSVSCPLTSREGSVAGGWIYYQWWWYNQPHLCNDASINPQKDGAQRASRLVDMWRFGESSVLGESMEAPHPFPIPCAMLLHPALPSIINLRSSEQNICLSSVLFSSKSNPRRGLLESLIYSLQGQKPRWQLGPATGIWSVCVLGGSRIGQSTSPVGSDAISRYTSSELSWTVGLPGDVRDTWRWRKKPTSAIRVRILLSWQVPFS